MAVFHVLDGRGAYLHWPYNLDSPRTLPGGWTEIPAMTSADQRAVRWREGYLEDPAALRHDLAGAFDDHARAAARILELVVPNPDGHNWAWTCTGTPSWCR